MERLILSVVEGKRDHLVLNLSQKCMLWLTYLHLAVVIVSLGNLTLSVTCTSSDDSRLKDNYIVQRCTNSPLLLLGKEDHSDDKNEEVVRIINYHQYFVLINFALAIAVRVPFWIYKGQVKHYVEQVHQFSKAIISLAMA